MIEDTSVNFGKSTSWTDLSSSAVGFTRSTLVPSSQSVSDRALIVYQNADESIAESEVTQLLAKARVVLPAVMNYLYFNSTKVAVVYFGKTIVEGQKVGIRTGAEDFKIRMIRFLTSEIWPTLLRTDAPDESLGHDYLRQSQDRPAASCGVAGCTDTHPADDAISTAAMQSASHSSPLGVSSPPNSQESPVKASRPYSKETAQELSWFKKSIENYMQVLLYLKNGINGTKYLKVILNNSAHRIHFDVIDPKEEKYRWELRMLYTRLMDNLETQKAIESYESYEANFRLACATAAANAVELERPLQEMTPVTLWGTAHHDKPVRLGHFSSTDDDSDDEQENATANDSECSDIEFVSYGGEPSADEREIASRLQRKLGRKLRSPRNEPELFSFTESSRSSSRQDSRPGSAFPPPRLPQLSCPPPAAAVTGRLVSTSGEQHSQYTQPGTGDSRTATFRDPENSRSDSATAATGPYMVERTAPRRATAEEGTPTVPGLTVNNETFTALSRGTTLNPSKTRYYHWMENLQRPESATLDYKSYFSHSAMEIRHRCVKFMCGFLNAYREGKLVIGVHEIPRRDADGKPESNKGGRNNIVLHNDLIDQFVIGVRVSEGELEDVQEDVSQQLLSCVPPIPPTTVSIDVVPVVFPVDFAYSQRVLILYEMNNYGPSRDALKQKSNYAIRFLNPLGLSLIPMDLVDHQLEDFIAAHLDSITESGNSDREETEGSENSPSIAANNNNGSSCGNPGSGRARKSSTRRRCKGMVGSQEFNPECLKAEAYLVASISDPATLTEIDWEAQLSEAINGPKSRCHHFFFDWPTDVAGPLQVPQLHVVEVSVDIKRCNSHTLQAYRGKFFTGWPSIPVWDAATRTVRRVERNYNLFGDAPTTQEAAMLANSMRSLGAVAGQGTDAGITPPSHAAAGGASGGTAAAAQPANLLSSPTNCLNVSASAAGFQRAMLKYGWSWLGNLQIMNNVLSYLYGPRRIHDVLQFRRVHPVWNRVFENRQGTPLVHMIHSTPVGVPMFNNSMEHISRTQYAFLHEGVPPMPLILCRIYEIIGNLPSPYPFVTVPLVQQSFRVSSFLIPIFYRQHYFDGTMRISVVLDLRDGILKTMQLRDGNLVLEPIVGMCFEKMNKRQVTRQLERIAAKEAELLLHQDNRGLHSKAASRSSTPRQNGGAARHGKYASNFLARRTLQPQMLRSTRGRMSSTILSPLLSENTRMTKREVEPNIPLIHFRFLTRKLLDEGSFIVSDSPHPSALPDKATGPPLSSSVTVHQPQPRQNANPTTTTKGLPPRPPLHASMPQSLGVSTVAGRGTSWTLQHLLSWYHALLADPVHLRVFGYCERSIAFNVSDFSEICEDDVEAGALDLASVKDLKFASCRDECTLHRKVMEWMEV